MNSSGIKRGLAATAVAALAVTGLPFLASSSSAAQSASDTLAQGATGPIRNANAAGGVVTIKSNSAALVTADLSITAADFSGTPVAIAAGKEISSPAFDVDVIGLSAVLDGDSVAPGIQKFADGFYHYELQTAVTLGTASKATFGLVEDMAPTGTANASDPKTVIEVTPTGAPASVAVSPASQTTAAGVASPDYTVTVKDAAGNLTQLVAGESFAVSSPQDAVATGVLDDTTLNDGTATFTATAPTAGTKTLNLADVGIAGTLTASASLNVIAQATIAENEFDIATGADTWSSTSTFGSVNTQIRVDQTGVTFNFVSKDGADLDTIPDDANKVVLLTLSSGTLKFGGKASETYAVVLDADGKGSLTVNPTGIVDGAQFTFASAGSSIASTTVTFARATATSVASDAAVYVTKVGSPTAVTVTVKDQFGNPIGAPAQVSITRGPRNGGTTTARQTVNATGQATFSLPDAGLAPGVEAFDVNLYDDQFDPSATTSVGVGTINYTADGLGADPVVTGATADPAATVITPLYDSAAGVGDSATINLTGATAGTPAKVTVDGGALVLTGAETNLTQGSASDTITLAGGNGSFTVVGTKTGVITVTIENAGRTKTVKLTVKQPAAGAALVATARNIELAGPAKANAGGVATFTATVTDAFGNPVAGVPASSLNFQISGPANPQGADAVTDANGKFKYNVILTDNANSSVKVSVTGVSDANTPQFGKAANAYAVANDAPGLSASANTDDVTITNVVNIAELEAAVAAAQEKVDTAQDNLDAANDNLAIAKAEQTVARQAVRAAKKELRQAKRHHKGVAAARKTLRAARGELIIANAKVAAAQAQVTRTTDRLVAAQAVLAAAQQALADAQN